jgi:hypothetical protein
MKPSVPIVPETTPAAVRLRVIVAALATVMLAGCAYNPAPPLGPTGNRSDLTKLVPVTVRDEWKVQVLQETKNAVTANLRFPTTALFDDLVQYEGYYDKTRNVTWVAVYGDVTSTGDAGQVDRNGYYVRWQQPGFAHQDFLPPWRLADVEVLDNPY